MTRQAINQRKYPTIPLPASIKEAVKAWAKENGVMMYKIGDLLVKLPELKPYLKGETR